MANPLAERPPSPDFPSWPFSCLDWQLRLLADYGRCAEAVGCSSDPGEVLRAETRSGVRLFGDLMAAYGDLAVAPLRAMQQAAADVPPAD